MSTDPQAPYGIRGVSGALLYLMGRAEYTPGVTIYVRTGEELQLSCAYVARDDGHTLEVEHRARKVDNGDLYLILKGLKGAPLSEVGEPLWEGGKFTLKLRRETV